MSEGARAELPWLRFCERTGISGWAFGAVWALLTSAITWAVHAVAGEIEYVRQDFEVRVPYGGCNATGFLMAAFVFHVGRTRRDVRDLVPGLPASEAERLAPSIGRAPRRGLWLAALVGFLLAATGQEVTVARWSRILGGDWNAVDLWVGPLMVGLWMILIPTFYSLYAVAEVLRRVGASLHVRLFERDLGRPLARFGLRTFLLFVVVPVLANTLMATLGAAYTEVTIFAIALSFGIGAICLTLPLGGLRRQVRDLKQAELARLDAAVQGDRTALAASPLAAQLEPLSLPELLAYRERVEAHPEWPLDTPVLARFGLYGLIPLLSWIAAALVERGLDVFLERGP